MSLVLALVLTAAKPALLPGVGAALRAGQPADVIVMVDGAPADVLAALPPETFTLHRTYETLSAFAGRATPAALAALAKDGRVTAVQLDSVGHADTAESGPAIGSTTVHTQFGITGKGVRVAVLDTGFDGKHPDLDGGLAINKCFVVGGCLPDGGNTGDLAPEGNGHGTHVAGTITSDGKASPLGIAPGAEIVGIRVFDSASVGRVSDWAAGLDWILANNATLRVQVVNLSLGTNDVYDAGCDAQQPLLAAAIDKLRDAGVIAFAATGNDGEQNGIDAPACIGAAVAVGATYDANLAREPDTGDYTCGCNDPNADAGSVICFSNSSVGLDLLAPGSRIRAAAPGGGVAERRGTSQATPHASAAAALMLEVDPRLSPADVERILKATGVPTTDPKNGRVTPRIDARAAVVSAFDSFCTRRADGEACYRALACDGGPCPLGACGGGTCGVVTPAIGNFPAAPTTGCSAALGGVALAALGFWLRRKRGQAAFSV